MSRVRFDPWKIPLGRPPPGVRPNFRNPVTIAPQAQAIFGLCMALIATFIGLRMYRRIVVSQNWGLDDCICHSYSVLLVCSSSCFFLIPPTSFFTFVFSFKFYVTCSFTGLMWVHIWPFEGEASWGEEALSQSSELLSMFCFTSQTKAG
jgi:hypothetical protein